MHVSTLFAGIALTASLVLPMTADAAGDPALGKKVFTKCAACHAIGPGAVNKVGPELNGIVGRPVASAPDYKYSPAMKEHVAEVAVWDEAALVPWLTNPKAVVAKTKMAFPGLKKPEDIENVIAYLKSFDAAGAPVAPAN